MKKLHYRPPWARHRGSAPRGAALAEMGIVIGLVSVVSIGGVYAVGDETKEIFCTAAGTLDKAIGGDGYCLGEMTAIDAVIEGPSFLDMMFEDHHFAMREIGGGLVLPRSGRLEGGVSLATDGRGGLEVAPCIGESCAPASADVASISWQKGDWTGLGYEITLPEITEEVNTSFDLTVTSLEDPTLWYTWTIGVTRPATPPALNDSIEFGDLHLADGASLDRTVLEVFGGSDAIGEFTLSAASRGGIAVGICSRVSDSYAASCSTPSVAGDSSSLDTGFGSIGYALANPEGVTVWDDYEDVIDVSMASDLTPGLTRTWAVHLTRPGLEPVLGTGLTFGDITKAAGQALPYAEMQSGVLSGGNGSYHLVFDGNGMFETRSCYKTANNVTFETYCTDWADVSTSITYPNSQAVVGYGVRAKTLTVWDDIDGFVDVTMIHDIDPEVTKSWDVHVTRPAQVPALASDIEFGDIEVAAGGSISQTVFKAPKITELAGDYGISANGNGVFDVRVCSRVGNRADPVCSDWGDTAFKEWSTANLYVIGFEMRLKEAHSTWEDFEAVVDVDLYHTRDESLGKSWQMKVTRPALEASLTVATNFPEVLELGVGNSLSRNLLYAPNISNLTGTYIVDVDGRGIFDVEACARVGNRSNIVCSAKGDTSQRELGSASLYRIGAVISPKADHSVWKDFDETLGIRIYHSKDETLGRDYEVQIVRPGKIAILDLGIDFPAVELAAGQSLNRQVMRDPQVNNVNSSYQLEVDGNGVFDVRVCHVYSSGSPVCKDWGDKVTSGNYSASYAQVGFEFRPKVDPGAAAVDETIGVKVFHSGDPDTNLIWNMPVTRPASE